MVFLSISRDPFLIYKLLLRVSGVWPEDRNKKGSAIVFSLLLMLVAVNLVIRSIGVIGRCPAYEYNDGELLAILWLVIVAVMKVALRVNGSKIDILIESTISDWKSTTDPEEREIMKRHDKFGSWILPMLPVPFYITVVIRIMLPFAFPDVFPSIPVASICVTNNDRMWEAIIHIPFTMLTILDDVTVHLGTLLYWSFGMHLSAQYKILKKRFEEFLLIKDKKESRRAFRRLVDRHNQLFDFNGILEDSFGFFVGLQIAMKQIMICLLACQLGHAIRDQHFADILDSLKHTVGCFLRIGLFYFVGDYLTTSCEDVGEAFTQCNWYNLSKESITEFSIVIARTRMPKTLTFWKFQQLNLPNLRRTFETIYSYISLIVGLAMDE